ncbi:hypothetical protein T484DRAFT_1785121, partial [Baffinella frigidus]
EVEAHGRGMRARLLLQGLDLLKMVSLMIVVLVGVGVVVVMLELAVSWWLLWDLRPSAGKDGRVREIFYFVGVEVVVVVMMVVVMVWEVAQAYA